MSVDLRRLMSFFSLLVLYGLLIFFVLILSRQILLDVSEGLSLTDTLVLPVILILPLVLGGAILYQGIQLFRQKRQGRGGVRLKIRLTLFFALTALLSSVPQGVLSINFLDTTMNSWFGSTLGEALEGGLKVALDYHHDKTQNLKAFAEGRALPEILQTAPMNNTEVFWQRIKEGNTALHSIQVFRGENQLMVEAGDPRGFIRNLQILRRYDGPLPKESSEDLSILRTLKHFEFGEEKYSVILGIVLPPGFDDSAKKLTRALETYRQLQKFNDTFRSMVVIFYILFALPIFLISLLISFSFSDSIIRPLVNLEEATRRVAEGDYSFRILTQDRDELSSLVHSFNTMVQELSLSRTKIMQTEKITAWQEIARQLAHEIRNPLTPIKLSAERILRKFNTEPENVGKILEAAVNAIVHEVTKLDQLLKEFSDFARLPLPQKEWISLGDTLEDVVKVYETSEASVNFHRDGLTPGIQIFADKKQLTQVFTNLIKNAVEAMEHRGDIFLRSSLVKKGNSSYARLQIQDTGPGIPQDHFDKVFNPYFTTKKEGTGLGLSIVERIIFDHQGSIWFESQAGYGATFFIDLFLEKNP